jgi:hypothetical protein
MAGQDTILDFNPAQDILLFHEVMDENADAEFDLDDLLNDPLDPNDVQYVEFNKIDNTEIELTVHNGAQPETTITLQGGDFSGIDELADLKIQVDPDTSPTI